MFKHGHGKKGEESPTYSTWLAMKTRCKNKNNKSYKYYGGRGIEVCSRWFEFKNFLIDMGEKPKGRTIDRIDNNKNYEPSNCRWASIVEQAPEQKKRIERIASKNYQKISSILGSEY